MQLSARDRAILALVLGLGVAVFLVDLYVLPSLVLPAAPFILLVLIAAYFLSPALVAGTTAWLVLLQLIAGLERGISVPLLDLYVAVVAISGLFGIIVASRLRKQGVLESDRDRLLAEARRQGALAAQERDRLSTVINSIADEVWFCNAEGKFSLLNEAAWKGLGFESQQPYETIPELVSGLEIYDLDGKPRAVEDAPLLRSLRGQVIESAGETVRHLKTGELRYRQVSSAPIRNGSGTIIGAVAVVRDVTEKKRARQERVRLLEELKVLAQTAEERASQFETVVDSIADAVFISDTAGRVTGVNRAALNLLGMKSKEDALRPEEDYLRFMDLRHGDGSPVTKEEMVLSRALHGEVVHGLAQMGRKLGSQRPIYFLVSSAPIRDPQGKIVGAVAVLSDITAIKEVDRLKDQFITVAAHELKTPLSIMKGYAQALIRARENLPEELRWTLDAISRGADRLDSIVGDLLDITRLTGGELELTEDRVDLTELTEEVLHRTALTTKAHRIELTRQEPVIVQGDRGRLGQVLGDLIDNAIRYSPRGGEIEVQVYSDDGEAQVAVKDRGIGIPSEKQGRIFERFYRAHTGTMYDYGGMGVALFMAREIIERHGGRMWFESREGKGSSFYFSLPMRPGSREG